MHCFRALLTVSIMDSTNHDFSAEKRLSDTDRELLELYHCTFNDNLIDMKLILALISQIHLDPSNKEKGKLFYT